jgi:hypothetical protein
MYWKHVEDTLDKELQKKLTDSRVGWNDIPGHSY